MKRVINKDVIKNIILTSETDLANVSDDSSLLDNCEAVPYFVLSDINDSNHYFEPWSSISIPDAVYKLAKTLCIVDDDSSLLKDFNHLQLILWFLADHKTGAIAPVNVFICDLSQLIMEVDDV